MTNLSIYLIKHFPQTLQIVYLLNPKFNPKVNVYKINNNKKQL
ncbi:unnamed protein product [Paramecium pentaurelia]|uniref:Uncharacterized protein n=1 Tax=Paramecium pentaurelia TaxID=43138 RepID=A0A8S1VWW8_9CILI|nr:unnamed protein product [Paramecium pentaurelia]